ncbi:restriction endonuclease subunit S [Chrysosporum bergii ANA360D]|uniref:Restriction endonuclease subunit S n=1 Tax=Chrysosporum bergii ANA360D TaxID=617107 RepID=A0AA43KCG0_9CYAN|nr:restriction endonuclease subunit S [Chrysosporum bergii]MDH6060853.1 restriction endonuclease subunit S [Chrysosporum bergii ANA360D]
MNNWKDLYWGELVTLEYGKPCPNYADNIGEYPVFGTNGKIGQSKKALCNHPSVIIGRKGAYRGVHYSDKPFWVIDTAFYLEPKVDIDLKWAYYNLLTQDINGMDSGSAIPSTSRQDFYFLSVKLPPLAEQKAIAHILGTLDDKIELNRQMNETLEAMAREIFKSWFVDFDPVRAKMEGRQPAGMDAATADLFPNDFEESSLGLIPKGWKVATIGESVKIVGGSTPSTKNPDYWEGGTIHWTTPKDLSSLSSPVLLNTERKITELGLKQISSGLLPKGTLLLSSRAPIGYLAISEIPVAINQGYIGMICDKGLPNYYILNWTRENIETIIGRANGTTFLEISKSNFRPIELVIPDIKILDVFIKQVERLYQMIVNNLQESHSLATLRDTLLPKLMSGEIRVKQAEKLLESVA